VGISERTHYCSYCLHYLDEIDDFCPHTPCGRTRPASGWAYFFEGGENIDGRFRIRNRLGAGGAGVTYRAIDLVADDPELRDVALKVLHHDRGRGILKDRLRLEGEVLRRLDHPNVVPFRELKVDGSEPYYLATGFVPGGSLDDLLRAQTKISARSVLVVGGQVARALAAAHSIGVIHRDLKPANILVRDLDEYPLVIRVADWGIARAFPEFVPRRHVTIQGGFVGTPEFASPEQLRGEPTVGPPTDVFGLGVLLHTLAGGQPIRDLVARGVVDFNKLREGASRYERVPLSLTRIGEAHMPLLDELLDQLITRSPEARPDAETVAAYCEELIEAGDTTPQRPVDSSALPALTPAAAFEQPKEELFLPADGGRAKPLQLGRDDPPPPPATDTLEFEDPSEVIQPSEAGSWVDDAEATPSESVETPWPRADEGALSTPTAVPEDMESLPAVEVLQEGAAPTRPAILREPDPQALETRTSPSPISERDDEPLPRRRSGLWVAGLLALLLMLACGGVIALAVGPSAVIRLASLGQVDDGGVPAGEGGLFSPDGRRQGLPDPPRSERRKGLAPANAASTAPPDAAVEPEAAATGSPPPGTGVAGGEAPRAVEAPSGPSAGQVVAEEPGPSEGFVVDHGIPDADDPGSVGRTGEGGSIWAKRPGAPSAWPTDYRLHKDRDGSRRNVGPRSRRGDGRRGGTRSDGGARRGEGEGSAKLGGRSAKEPPVEESEEPEEPSEGTVEVDEGSGEGNGGKFGGESESEPPPEIE